MEKMNYEPQKTFSKFWKDRSKLERNLILLAFIIIVILIVTVLIYTLILKHPEICTTSVCLASAMEVLGNIDQKIDPCVDFYEFACGNFLKNAPFDASDQSVRSAHDKMRDEIDARIRTMLEQPIEAEASRRPFDLAKMFYRACANESAVDSDAIKEIKQIFRKIGGWPILDGDAWDEGAFEWKKAVHVLRQLGVDFTFFMALTVEKDKTDPTKHMLQLSDPYSTHNVDESTKNIYLKYMEDVAIYFGGNRITARNDQKDVLDLALKLTRVSQEGRRLNRSGIYNPYLLSELQFEFKSINWYDYINGILSPSASVTYDDAISVADPYYIKELEYIMSNTSARVLANFMAWHTLQGLATYLPNDLVNRAYDYMEKINGEMFRKPRWHACVNAVKKKMGPVVSAAYIEEHFSEETRQQILDMISTIKMQYRKTVRDLKWMDEPTRKLALEKLVQSVENVLSLNDITSLLAAANIYSDAKIYEDNLIQSVLDLNKLNMNKEYRKFHQKVRKTVWLEDPDFTTGLTILFDPKENLLVFPAGLFDSIFFGKNKQHYLNYGALGVSIAHKVWHTFIEAEYRNVGGDARSWWSPETLLNYEDRLQCLARQFASLPERNALNTSRSKEETLGYIMGVKIAYDSYERFIDDHGKESNLPGIDFTPEQLFWVSVAAPYCTRYSESLISTDGTVLPSFNSPEKIRVNELLKNLPEFSDDFRCGTDDLMNLENRCRIF